MQSAREWYRNGLAIPGAFALLKLLIHLPVLGRYGYHHDELYFIACGNHAAFGYVDHSPLVPWIARFATTLFGDSLYGLRILATLAGAAALFGAGLLAHRLGGGRFAQLLTCVAMIIAPVYLRTGNFLAIPSFEPLFWVASYYLLVRIIQEENPRLWYWLGLFVGLGIMNKHSMLFFAVGLVGGVLLTPLRRSLRSIHVYLAAGIALLIFLPNLIWQVTHGWPTVGFLVDLNAGVMSRISIWQFLFGQLLYIHPVNAVLWVWGLWFLFSSRPYRVFGWIWLIVFVLLALGKSKIYYLAPSYPVLLAAGSIGLEGWIRRTGRRWLKPVSVGALVLTGAALLPVSLPVMSIDRTERWMRVITFGMMENIYELTGDHRGMFGWRERVEIIAGVWDGLSAEERERAVIFGPGYGIPGAVDLLGAEYGLPRAYSVYNNYWLWGPPEDAAEIVIGAGFPPDALEPLFEEIEVAAEVELENVNPWSTPFIVTVGRRPKVTFEEIWPENRPW
jgi:hypothetical protein